MTPPIRQALVALSVLTFIVASSLELVVGESVLMALLGGAVTAWLTLLIAVVRAERL